MGYIPDAGNNGDIEYMSAFYRYTTSLLPFADPTGEHLADQCIQRLQSLQTDAAAPV